MKSNDQLNYNRIAEAIEYITLNFKQQPSLDVVAEKIKLSPYHFQRLFTDWAGVSPKKFLQYISIQHARHILKDKSTTLFDAAHQTGLSGTGRLHDLFITIEGMTPGEFKNGGELLCINYSFSNTHFGNVIVASTTKGICYMAFIEDESKAFKVVSSHFPNALFIQKVDSFHQQALSVFTQKQPTLSQLKLHLKATNFQLKVWESLLKIPMGQLSTYGNIAQAIKNPNASRAVGTAIGSNPVAFLIPCHRVIQSTGLFGGYMWGPVRKTAIIGWEAAKTNDININS